MKKISIIVISLVMTMGALAASVGKITKVRGAVFVIRSSGKIVGKVGLPLEKSDIVQTKARGWAKLKFNDGTVITVGRNSRMEIKKYLYDGSRKSEASFGFAKGVFKTITGAIGKVAPEKFKVHTPNATIGIRGTEFFVEIVKNRVRVICSRGRISVSNRLGEVEVNAGRETIVAPSSKPTSATPINMRIFKRVQHKTEPANRGGGTRGAREKRSVSTFTKRSLSSRGGDIKTLKLSEDEKRVLGKSYGGLIGNILKSTTFNESAKDTVELIRKNIDKQLEKRVGKNIEKEEPEMPEGPPLGPPPGEQESVYEDDYTSFGYWMRDNRPVETWVTGTLTDDSVIEDLASHKQQAHYKGDIAAISAGKKASGKIELDVDFGASRFEGAMNFAKDGGPRWKADIKDGQMRANGLFSEHIQSSVDSDVKDIRGSMTGNFFGPKAEAVGGSFGLESDDAGSASGSFGARR